MREAYSALTSRPMPVMRRMTWASMDEAARRALCERGLEAIFDEGLKASIGRIIDERQQRVRPYAARGSEPTPPRRRAEAPSNASATTDRLSAAGSGIETRLP